jgi:glycosyltransferase involved in cell wall biosynthesis
MTRIAILTPSITSRDAVSNDVLGMYEVLRELGHETRIFAEGWTLDQPRIWPAPKLEGFLKKPADLLIYHYSRGWDFGLQLLRELKCRTVVRYHNVTPPEFSVRFSKDYARMCGEGRDQLTAIARADSDLYMSASRYNEQELIEAGAPTSKSVVIPPFHHIDRLDAVEADPGILKTYGDGLINILMVGRISPNKGHAALIEAFAAYHKDYNRHSRLLIVGKGETRLRAYTRLLHELVGRFQLDDAVVFCGEVTDEELKAFYEVAHVFMITSEHEGFCVPLVEAMSMKVPVVAYSSSAIPGTLGGVGLVWDEKNPYLLAESVNRIIKGSGVGAKLGQMGRRRFEQNFTNGKIREGFLEALGKLL